MANGKHRKTRIFRLEQEEGIIKGDVNLKKLITNYYKGLFGDPVSNNFSMLESFTSDIYTSFSVRKWCPNDGIYRERSERSYFSNGT